MRNKAVIEYIKENSIIKLEENKRIIERCKTKKVNWKLVSVGLAIYTTIIVFIKMFPMDTSWKVVILALIILIEFIILGIGSYIDLYNEEKNLKIEIIIDIIDNKINILESKDKLFITDDKCVKN